MLFRRFLFGEEPVWAIRIRNEHTFGFFRAVLTKNERPQPLPSQRLKSGIPRLSAVSFQRVISRRTLRVSITPFPARRQKRMLRFTIPVFPHQKEHASLSSILFPSPISRKLFDFRLSPPSEQNRSSFRPFRPPSEGKPSAPRFSLFFESFGVKESFYKGCHPAGDDLEQGSVGSGSEPGRLFSQTAYCVPFGCSALRILPRRYIALWAMRLRSEDAPRRSPGVSPYTLSIHRQISSKISSAAAGA